MVAAMSNVSHVNATLLDRVSSAEEKARELENKFAHMEMEVARKEGQGTFCVKYDVGIQLNK